jgi:peptide/nickel transport system substrate-binding protein
VKKVFFISLMVILTIGMILGGCGEEEPTTTPTTPATTKPAATTTPATTPPKTTPAETKPAETKPAETTPAKVVPTGTLRATVPSWIETMDPNLQTTFEYALYEHLLTTDENNNYVGELAESWGVSDDGLVWTFKLRKGVKFHNGDEFTSADAKFSFERTMKEGSMSPWSPEYNATIDHIETPDPYTLEIYCKKVNYQFYASIWGCPMLPKNYIEENGDEYFNNHPIGTAPWKFVKLTPSVSIEFEAITDHWRLTPQWAKLIVQLIPESSTALAKLRQGETDIVSVNMDEALQVQDEGYELRILGRPSTPVICMLNTWASDGPISDVRVREALSLAINRQEIADIFFNGLAEPGGILWTAPSSWGFDPAWMTGPYFKYDPAKARDLLKEAGYPSNFANPVITLYSMAYLPWLPDLNQIVAAYWGAIGVQTKIETIDFGQLRGMMYVQDPAMTGKVAIWNMPTVQLSVAFLRSAIHSEGNWQLLHDPEFDSLWASVSLSPDQDTQLDLFHQTVEYMLSQYICPGIVNIYSYYAVSDQIGDWTLRFQYDLWGGFAGIKKK